LHDAGLFGQVAGEQDVERRDKLPDFFQFTRGLPLVFGGERWFAAAQALRGRAHFLARGGGPALQPFNDALQVLRVLRGDFFCLPFGGNATAWHGEKHPLHGETANREWRLESFRFSSVLFLHFLLLVAGVAVSPWRFWPVWAGVAVALASIAAASRVPVRFLLARLLLLEPFALGVALLSLLQPDGGRTFLALLIKSTLCLATLLLLANTTPFSGLLALMRRMRVPSLLVTVIALMYRYVFVVIDEAERLQRARASRAFSARRAQSWRGTAALVGRLFVRSSERAERVYAAMCARGWKP
jgi:cobalt/nickel transport system permease protein